jgi:hypothetical protein
LSASASTVVLDLGALIRFGYADLVTGATGPQDTRCLRDRRLSYPVVAIAVAVARLKKVPDTFCLTDAFVLDEEF